MAKTKRPPTDDSKIPDAETNLGGNGGSSHEVPVKQTHNEVRWDLRAVFVEEVEEIQKALDEGYEPFAATPQPKMPDPSAIISLGQKPQMMMTTMLWFKRGLLYAIESAPTV